MLSGMNEIMHGTHLTCYLPHHEARILPVNPTYTSCPHSFSSSSLYFSHHQLPLLRNPSFRDIIPYVAACLHRQELACVAQTCFLCATSFALQDVTLLKDRGCLLLLSASSQSPYKLGTSSVFLPNTL